MRGQFRGGIRATDEKYPGPDFSVYASMHCLHGALNAIQMPNKHLLHCAYKLRKSSKLFITKFDNLPDSERLFGDFGPRPLTAAPSLDPAMDFHLRLWSGLRSDSFRQCSELAIKGCELVLWRRGRGQFPALSPIIRPASFWIIEVFSCSVLSVMCSLICPKKHDNEKRRH